MYSRTAPSRSDEVELSFSQALNYALSEALERDETVTLLGQDIGRLGGLYRVTTGLVERYGSHRIIDAPVAESGLVGAAIGMAMNGLKPVVELQFDAFSYPALEQIFSHLAKFCYRTQGAITLPVVIRIPYGGGIGAVEHHSDSSEAYFAHTPGLRVVTPSTPSDAYGMLKASIASRDPVIFLEPKRRYWDKECIDLSANVSDIEKSLVRRKGTDVTIISYGGSVAVALEAAELAFDHGWDVEVVDLRSLAPFDDTTSGDSVRKTGRCIVVHEAPRFLGYGAEVAARLTEECFHYLSAPILRVAGLDAPYPPPRLEGDYLPSVSKILEAIKRLQWDESQVAVTHG
ncbi:alpha-ketoacid dehydrogenase subunit beta [Nocardia vulneris]|uniref:alpha-ketoacid dehydrogenase subunit beta n=1 Tax=Nocardia vulneris TaxID=1141657 RepID=UPI00068F855A|nr:alpha-ketoacid dehydrogenase subunit beta [Nocardia vulneris]